MTLEDGADVYPETLVTSWQPTPRNIAEERRLPSRLMGAKFHYREASNLVAYDAMWNGLGSYQTTRGHLRSFEYPLTLLKEPEISVSLPCSQRHKTRRCCEPDQSLPHTHGFPLRSTRYVKFNPLRYIGVFRVSSLVNKFLCILRPLPHIVTKSFM